MISRNHSLSKNFACWWKVADPDPRGPKHTDARDPFPEYWHEILCIFKDLVKQLLVDMKTFKQLLRKSLNLIQVSIRQTFKKFNYYVSAELLITPTVSTCCKSHLALIYFFLSKAKELMVGSRGSLRDVIYLGWPRERPRIWAKCGWGRVAGSQPMSAAVQIKPKGDPTPYFAYDGQINEDEMAEKITLITTQADPGICCRR